MSDTFWLDRIPLAGMFLLTTLFVLLSIWLGAILGNKRKKVPEHEGSAALGTISGATLGLLAFMLAFTFGITAGLFQNRRQLLLDEVNTITTTYLRAGLLLEPYRSEMRDLLRQYVDTRASLANNDAVSVEERVAALTAASDSVHEQMWSRAGSIALKERSSEIDALFIESLNEMMELHTSRLNVFRYRIPPVIWYVLYLVTFLSMFTVGYHSGLCGKNSIVIGLILAFTFSSVVLLIIDLDRVTKGYFRVSQKPITDLQKKISAQTPPDVNRSPAGKADL